MEFFDKQFLINIRFNNNKKCYRRRTDNDENNPEKSNIELLLLNLE